MLKLSYLLAIVIVRRNLVVSAEDNEQAETPAVRISTLANKDRSEAWGSIELLGGGSSYEFVKALFGSSLHCKYEPIRMSEPVDCCEKPDPAVASGAILLVDRGKCSFADKAFYAQSAGAVGMILINSDQAIPRLPAAFMNVTEEHEPEITIPVTAIRQSAGSALKKILSRETIVLGAVVAKKWSKEGTYLTGPCSQQYNDKHNIDEKVHYDGVEMLSADGGLLTTAENSSFEYLRAEFGGPIPNYPTHAVELVRSEPMNGCEELTNSSDLKGKVALIWRGGCSFTKKSEYAEAAGAIGVLVVNNSDVLVTMAGGDILEDEVTIFTAMIGKSAGEELKDMAKSGIQIKLKSTDVMASDWDSIETTTLIEEWPEDAAARKERYNQLLLLHDPSKSTSGHSTRLAMVNKIYEEAEAYWNEENEL